MAGGGGGDGEPEFQIAPMIDVLLVLLIFFMSITSTQVLKVDRDIQLPVAPNALKKDDTRNESIVNVKWDDAKKAATFVLDSRNFTGTDELSKALVEAKKAGDLKVAKSANQQFRIVIRGDENAPALQISRAMNAAADAGIADISFSAVNKKEGK